MLKFVFNIFVILMVLGASCSEQEDQNSTIKAENATKSIQDDTTIPEIPKSADTPEVLEKSSKLDDTEAPAETQDDNIDIKPQNDQSQTEIADQITLLSEKILDLVESYSDQNNKASNSQNNPTKRQFFLTFMTEKSNGTRKMTVNNNFQATNLAPTQNFLEQGTESKQPPSPNIQMTVPGMQQKQQNNVQNNMQNPMQNPNYPNYPNRKFSRNLENSNSFGQNPVQGQGFNAFNDE